MDIDESLIHGTEKLIGIMGKWPSFHDAEITELHLDRRGVVLRLRIHVFETTKELDAAGYYVLGKHTLVTFEFSEIDDLEMNDFNQQNVIFSLYIERENAAPGASTPIKVNIGSSYGMKAKFKCERIEVVDAVPCSDRGEAEPHS